MGIFEDHLLIPMIFGIITLIAVILIVIGICSRHKDFIKNAKLIHNGMSKDKVLEIMGEPTSVENEDGKQIFIWEKSQWKGIQNGGTLVRSLKVIFKNNIVISVSNKNLNESTFW